MALDLSNIDFSTWSAKPDFSSLMPRNQGVLSNDTLSQWAMLQANSKAAKAAIAAEARGYLRDSEAPEQPLMSEKLYNSADRSTTIKDVLELLGREPTKVEEEPAPGEADEADGAAETETPAESEETTDNGLGGTIDVTA